MLWTASLTRFAIAFFILVAKPPFVYLAQATAPSVTHNYPEWDYSH